MKQIKTANTVKIFKNLKLQQVFPYILLAAATVGFTASFVLTIDHIALLKDPGHQLGCNLNPILSCGPVMQSKAAVIFGFPNSLLGIASFAAMGLLGFVLLAGARLKSWFWKLYGLSVIASLGMMLYLMQQSLFVLKAICIYCLGVWIVLIFSAWYTLQYMLAEKHLSLYKKPIGKWLRIHHGEILMVIYVILLAIILKKFWYYYGPMLGF